MMNINVYKLLKQIKERLTNLDGIKTLKIGIEPNISPSDYPIIRIVVNRNTIADDFDKWANDIYFSVYFGAKIDEKKGLESIYEYLYTLEATIKERLHNHQIKGELNSDCLIRFENTQSDNDTLKNFKILVSEFKIESAR